MKRRMSENTTVVKRKLMWELTGKEKMEAYIVGKCILSQDYDIIVDGKLTQWYLQLYPNGNKSENQNYFSLFLGLKKPILADFDANFKFGIVGEKAITREGERSSEQFKELNGFGFDQWIQRDLLLEFFVDDKLTIFCELTISASPRRRLLKIEDDPTVDFSHMYEREELKDCQIHTIDGVTLKFHKCVLAARSEVFYKMFTIDMVEARSNVVEIKDFVAETLTQLLRFAYGLKVENLKKIAHDLIFAAEKYEMKKLKDMCLCSLIENLDQQNVLQSLVAADKVSDAEILLDKCVFIVAGNYEALSKTPEWKTLPHSTKDNIIGRLARYYNDEQKIYSSTNF